MATLTSEIERKKQEIENEYSRKCSEIEDISALEQELIELEEALATAKGVSSTPVNDSLLHRIFKRKEYKTEVERVAEAKKEVRVLKEKISSLRSKIKRASEDLITFEEERNEALAIIEKEKNPVELCIRDDQELLSDLEFLKSCVEHDLSNIVLSTNLDERDQDELFAHFATCYKHIHMDEEEMRRIGYSEKDIKIKRGAIDYVVSELRNPKAVEEGKYKIPHRYLRDSIMNQYALFDPTVEDKEFSRLGDVLTRGTKGIADLNFFEYVAGQYANYDGKISVEYGQVLEELYDDPDSYLYMHFVNYRGHFRGEEIVPVCESICENGLRLPLVGNEFGKPRHTTLNTDDDRCMTGLDFMHYWGIDAGVVILQVPKKIVDSADPYIGWVYVEENGYTREDTYMLPEYVVGYTCDGKFVKNPIPLEQREALQQERFHKFTTDAHKTNIDSHRTI